MCAKKLDIKVTFDSEKWWMMHYWYKLCSKEIVCFYALPYTRRSQFPSGGWSLWNYFLCTMIQVMKKRLTFFFGYPLMCWFRLNFISCFSANKAHIFYVFICHIITQQSKFFQKHETERNWSQNVIKMQSKFSQFLKCLQPEKIWVLFSAKISNFLDGPVDIFPGKNDPFVP